MTQCKHNINNKKGKMNISIRKTTITLDKITFCKIMRVSYIKTKNSYTLKEFNTTVFLTWIKIAQFCKLLYCEIPFQIFFLIMTLITSNLPISCGIKRAKIKVCNQWLFNQLFQ